MAGFEKLIGWFNSWIADLVEKLTGKDTVTTAIETIAMQGNSDALEAVWTNFPDEVKTNPRVLAAYNAAKAKNLPKAESLISEITKLLEISKEALKKTYMSIEPVPVSGAFDAALGVVSWDFTKDVAIGVMGISAEIASAGQIDTVTDFFKVFRAKTGYGGIITSLMKAPLEMSLMRPLSYFLHDAFRNELPPLRDIADLSVKGNLEDTGARAGFASGIFGVGKPSETDKDIFDAIGGYGGLEKWYLDAAWDGRWRELRLGEIAWAMNDALIDDKQLDRMLGYAKYSPTDRPLIISIIREKYLRTYRDRVANQIRNLYKEGYIDKATFDARLEAQKIPKEVREKLAIEAGYLYQIDYNADLIATWTTAYRNDIISEDVLRGNLASIIVDPARVESQVNKAKASRKPAAIKPPKPVTQGIRVTSKPSNASIFLDGVDSGKLTPQTLETSAGTHALVLSADGYEDAEYAVELAAGQFVELYAVLVPLPELPD